MITAIDTNVLLDILLPNDQFFERSAEALQNSATEGSLVIADIAYAELSVHFAARPDCDDFLESSGIRVQPLTRDALFLASRAWRMYRRQGGKRSRILADFLIGAHGQKQADRLLSRDRGFYAALFPDLKLFDPSRSQ
jgi:predicted nucleic acid-binding protein